MEPFILSFLGALAACLILLALEVQLLSLWDASFVEFGYGYRFMVVAGAVGVALGPSTILLVAMGDARFLMWSSSICMVTLLGYGMNHDLAFRGFVELFCSYLIIDIVVKFIRVIWKISLLRPQSSVS